MSSKDDRAARLKSQLRANLKRRKVEAADTDSNGGEMASAAPKPNGTDPSD